jgi:hypothetical protein
MKNLVHYLLLVPITYSGFMLSKTPSLSDAIIVASLSCLVGFLRYLNVRYDVNPEVSELSKLEGQLREERLRLSIEQTKEAAIRDKSLRDARSASMGYEPGKQIKF